MEAAITNFSDENFSLKKCSSRDIKESEKEEEKIKDLFCRFQSSTFPWDMETFQIWEYGAEAPMKFVIS